MLTITIKTIASERLEVFVPEGTTVAEAAAKADFALDFNVYTPYINGQRVDKDTRLTQAHNRAIVSFQKTVTGNC